jgi:hypothetical protein
MDKAPSSSAGLSRMTKELRLLALIWLGLAVGAWIATDFLVVAIFAAPPLAFVLAALPTLLIYFSVGAVVYVVLRPVLAWAPPSWARWIAAGAAAALALLAGWTIPSLVNPIVRARTAALRAGEMRKPVHLAPRGTIALVALDGNPVYAHGSNDTLKVCDAFCTSLLLSGYAKTVIVAFDYSRSGTVAPTMSGVAFTLDDDSPDCVQDEPEWKAYFAGKPYAAASATGGFDSAFAARFSQCIATSGSVSVSGADMVLVDYFPSGHAGHTFPADLVSVYPIETQTILESPNHRPTLRLWRSLVHAATLDRPIYIAFGGGPDVVNTDWARSRYEEMDPGPFLTRWWGMIDNGDAVYARATGEPG